MYFIIGGKQKTFRRSPGAIGLVLSFERLSKKVGL